MKHIYKAIILCVISLVSACGGGGGSADYSGPLSEGVYKGTMTTTGGATIPLFAIVLANSPTSAEYWATYTTQNGATLDFWGPVYGTGMVSNNHYSSSNARDFSEDPQAVGTVSVFPLSATSFGGSSSIGTNNSQLAGSVWNDATYNYNTPAQPSNLVSDWAIRSSDTGSSYQINIASNGVITGTYSNCTFAGMIVPRIAQKNLYLISATITATGGTCALLTGRNLTGALSGVGILVDSNPALLLMLKNAGGTDGITFTGVKITPT